MHHYFSINYCTNTFIMANSKTKTSASSSGKKIWSFIDGFAGDRVIFMIVLILIMISILAISSSTSLLANQLGTTRSAIIREQFFIVIVGLAVMFMVYYISPKFFKFISKYGFLISVVLLSMLVLKVNLPFVKALHINDAYRSLSILGFQLHVYEFVKIFMVMYLGWAVQAYKDDDFAIANSLAKMDHFAFMQSSLAKKIMYIYAPILLVSAMIMVGSVSSTLFIGLIMGATILVGGIRIKELIPVILVGFALVGLAVGAYFASDGKMFERIGTGISRIAKFSSDSEQEVLQYEEGTIEFKEALDKNRQALGAKLAVKEGILPKGPGRSTQKYTVPVIFEDYMFAFIVEEYGLLGALVILLLYGSLLARGSRIVRYCDSIYQKTVIAGLVLLISGQALMHMLINVDLAPMTGQTLPMISHGKSSFLAFSLAFGVILSISRSAEKRLLAAQEEASAALAASRAEEAEGGEEPSSREESRQRVRVLEEGDESVPLSPTDSEAPDDGDGEEDLDE